MRNRFSQQKNGVLYLIEGGSETELMHKFGFELTRFAMFPLLDYSKAVAEMEGMFRALSRYRGKTGSRGADGWVGLPYQPGLRGTSGLFQSRPGRDAASSNRISAQRSQAFCCPDPSDSVCGDCRSER